MSLNISLPAWTRKFLFGCAAYYFLCGVSAFTLPSSWFWIAGITPKDTEQAELLLMVIGAPMIALMFAALISAFAPAAQWSLLSILFLANFIDLLVNVHAGLSGHLPIFSSCLFVLIGLFWCVGLGILLSRIYNANVRTDGQEKINLLTALELRPLGSAASLAELSDNEPLLLILIRHSGCTFCREALERLSTERKNLTGPAPRIVIVGLSSAESVRQLAEKFGLTDALIVSDQDQILYRALEIRRGSLWRLFGPRELWSALVRGALFRHGLGTVEGDPFQLPGTAVIHHRRAVVVRAAKSAADYCEIAPLIAEAGKS